MGFDPLFAYKAAGKGLGGMFKGKAGEDAGNPYLALQGDAQNASQAYLKRSAQDASSEVMADPRLAAIFGQNWQDVLGEERDLATRGYELQPQDREAYGQAAGDIARQFGQRDMALSQALAARGLSKSGGARSAIAGSVGSKQEQLARLQTDIAQRRMDSNLNRLSQTRGYLNQIMGQYQGALGAKDQLAQSKGQMGMQALGGLASQGNENMAQRQATAKNSTFSNALSGAISGGVSGLVTGGPVGAAAGAGAGGVMGANGMGAASGQAGAGLGNMLTKKKAAGDSKEEGK